MLENKIQASGEIVKIEKRGIYSQVIIKNNESKYETLVSFDFKSDKFESHPIKEGDQVECRGFVSSKEWNGKYFTSIYGNFLKVISKSKPSEEPDQFDDSDAF